MPPSQSSLLDELEVGLDGSKRQTRISDTAKVTIVVHSAIQRALRVRRFVVAAAEPDEQRADQRQEGDDGEGWARSSSVRPRPNMNQVMSAAAPISMAKA